MFYSERNYQSTSKIFSNKKYAQYLKEYLILNDILANTLGGVIGYGVYAIVSKKTGKSFQLKAFPCFWFIFICSDYRVMR